MLIGLVPTPATLSVNVATNLTQVFSKQCQCLSSKSEKHIFASWKTGYSGPKPGSTVLKCFYKPATSLSKPQLQTCGKVYLSFQPLHLWPVYPCDRFLIWSLFQDEDACLIAYMRHEDGKFLNQNVKRRHFCFQAISTLVKSASTQQWRLHSTVAMVEFFNPIAGISS